jgi:hypothetical protein
MNKMIKAFAVLVGVIFFVSHLNAWIYFNGVEVKDGVSSGNQARAASLDSENNDLSGLIVKGASHFIQAGHAIFSLLNEAEMSGIGGFSFLKAPKAAESAAEHLEIARTTYIQTLSIIKEMNFDQELVCRLKEFDYQGFAALKKLHPDVMERVASLMSQGNIMTVYEKAPRDIEGILNTLSPIANTIQQGIVPKIEDIRTLYLQYSDNMLFGFYVSMVFSEIQ